MAKEKTKVTVVDQSVGAGDTEVVIIHEVHENETKSRWEWRFPAMPLYYITLEGWSATSRILRSSDQIAKSTPTPSNRFASMKPGL